MNYKILTGDNRVTLKSIPDNSIDAIVTDPPYGIDFLGKSWDANTGALETYQECLRVLKPGGHILAFSAARTYHHLAITLEQAGFEIRDQIMWIYSSGFPKSQDVGRSIQRSLGVKKTLKKELVMQGGFTNWSDSQEDKTSKKQNETIEQVVVTDPEAQKWAGWGTALKPAHEPIALARKPMKLSIAKNCQEWGVGALNIDATRVPYEDGDTLEEWKQRYPDVANGSAETHANFNPEKRTNKDKPKPGIIGRDPRNNLKSNGVESDIPYTEQEWIPSDAGRFPANVIGEIPDYQKYFYCPKVSRKERHIGHEIPPAMFGDVQGAYGPDGNRMAVGFDNRAKPVGYIGSTHPDDIKKHPLWDPSIGTNPHRLKEKISSSQSVITNDEMVKEMGGHYTDEGAGKSIWLPGKGVIFAHGLKHEYAKWCMANGKPINNVGNNHPTVKPVELMKYLIKLITPPGGTVLDPFNGSGSTGMAAVELGYNYIGCELDPNYVEIAKTRIEAWYQHTQPKIDPRVAELFV